MPDFHKLPRLYVQNALSEGHGLSLEGNHHHYLKNVMRTMEGDALRLFNGMDGEFIGRIERTGKKSVELTIENCLRKQPALKRRLHLLFPPLKKERLDFLVEKSVELGATDFHPVLTKNTDVRKINEERIKAQIIEAAEQCERLDIPALHGLQNLPETLSGWNGNVPVLAALERFDAPPVKNISLTGDAAFLIGPAGGFTEEEKDSLSKNPAIRPVSLGENILRSETAAIMLLACSL
jgi:16S rRNA (uracil1498-N3)-methyltransferase